MAHNLIEVDEFTTPIVVPDGPDSRSNASAVVTGIAQALANRTLLLGTHAAFHDANNVFSDVQTFAEDIELQKSILASVADAGVSVLRVNASAADDANPANVYKMIMQALLAGTSSADVTLAVGRAGSQAQCVIAVNAVWNRATQRWVQQDAGQESSALLLNGSGQLRTSRQPAGTGPWSTWPTGTAGTGLLQSDAVQGRDVYGSNSVLSGGSFLYAVPRNETPLIDLASGVSSASTATFSGDRWLVDGAFNFLSFPVRGVAGGTLGLTQIMLRNPGGAALTYNIALKYKNSIGWGPAVLPTVTTRTSVSASIAGTTTAIVAIDWSALAVSAANEYWIEIDGAVAAPAAFEVRAIRFARTNPGPI